VTSGFGLGLSPRNSVIGLGLGLAFEGLGLECCGLVSSPCFGLADAAKICYIISATFNY